MQFKRYLATTTATMLMGALMAPAAFAQVTPSVGSGDPADGYLTNNARLHISGVPSSTDDVILKFLNPLGTQDADAATSPITERSALVLDPTAGACGSYCRPCIFICQ